jgi:TPP-dependent pyruvate/acetoin dehydrogenase alpha subunit
MTPRSKEKNAAIPAPPAAQNGFSLISNDKLLQLYSTMLKCRALDERLRAHFKQEKCPGRYFAYTGQEAAAVGAALDLLPEDTFISPRGDPMPSFLKGAPLEKLFANLRYPSTPPTRFVTLNLATEAAKTNKRNKTERIAVAIFPSEPTSPVPWHKALRFAALHRLPMVVVSWMKINHLKTTPCDFPAITVDGNDVVAVYRVASEAITHARKGNGPTHVQCTRWKANDPILNMEKYLNRKDLLIRNFKPEVVAGFNKELDAALENAQKLSSPKRIAAATKSLI